MSFVRCPRCEQNYSTALEACPSCGTASLWRSPKKAHKPPEGATASIGDSEYIYLPTGKLFVFLAMLIVATASVVFAFIRIVNAVLRGGGPPTTREYVLWAIGVACGVVLRCFRFAELNLLYHGSGKRLAVTAFQALLIVVLVFGSMAIAIVTMVAIGK